LDLFTVGPKFTRPAYHMQLTMRIARRCTTSLLPLALGQTDERTDRRTLHRFNTLTTHAVRVIRHIWYGKWYGMVNVDLYSAIIAKVSNALYLHTNNFSVKFYETF